MPAPNVSEIHSVLKVPVVRIPARVIFNAGEVLSVEIFLPTRSPSGEAMTVQDMLNGDQAFLPAARQDGAGTVLLQKNTIRWVEQHRLDPAEHFVSSPGATERGRVEIHMNWGEVLGGRLRYDMPPHACRLSDFLNRSERFIALGGEVCRYLVNKDYVAHVTEVED